MKCLSDGVVAVSESAGMLRSADGCGFEISWAGSVAKRLSRVNEWNSNKYLAVQTDEIGGTLGLSESIGYVVVTDANFEIWLCDA
jgi:hypothetical protein